VAAASGDRLEALWLTALHLGLRPGELRGLVWRDIDLEATPTVLHLREAMQQDGTLGALKSGARRRSLALPTSVAEALLRHLDRQVAERATAGDRWVGSFDHLGGLVWATGRGTAINGSNLRRSFAQLRERAGVEGRWSPYACRHTAVSLLSDAGLSAERIADVMGHRDTRMIFRTYRHVLTDVIHTTATALDGVFGTNGSENGSE
jgi:integrase